VVKLEGGGGWTVGDWMRRGGESRQIRAGAKKFKAPAKTGDPEGLHVALPFNLDAALPEFTKTKVGWGGGGEGA
jgi:hypothetical protein